MEQKKLVNLTKDTVRFYPENPMLVPATYLSQGEARVEVHALSERPINTDMHWVPLVRREYGEITGLPDPEDGVIYIVTGDVQRCARDARQRRDLVTPDMSPKSVVKDDTGAVIGVRRFTYDL